MKIEELQTPCLVVDKGRLISNINVMANHVYTLGCNLRPHVKTTKSYDILQLAMNDNCSGITVSTLKEADYFFENGVRNILYAVGIAPEKLEHCATLIVKGADLTLILDSLEQARFLIQKAEDYGVVYKALVEIDCDGHRSGVDPKDTLLIEICQLLDDSPFTDMQGVITHAGGSYSCSSVEHIKRVAENERAAAIECAERIKTANLPCPVVSIGSTPTVKYSNNLKGITEVRCGVYMFYDLVMAGLNVCGLNNIAISVLTTVIGHQKKKNWVITDAGWMALSRDRGTADQRKDQKYGVVCDINGRAYEELVVISANQEHGIVAQTDERFTGSNGFEIGDKMRILPNHACATSSMHNCYYVIDDSGEVVHIWDRINGW